MLLCHAGIKPNEVITEIFVKNSFVICKFFFNCEMPFM